MGHDWPDCAIDGCPRKCCLALDSIYCFPHTDGNRHVKLWKIGARNAPPVTKKAAPKEAELA